MVVTGSWADKLEVLAAGRMAHELEDRHGEGALHFAQKRMQQALDAGDNEEHSFWQMVVGRLRPR